MSSPAEIAPDTKDWTWVLDRPCPECGLDSSGWSPADVAREIRTNTAAWKVVLAGPRATTRPEPSTWSPTEYAAHVRDVHAVFGERVALMLAENDPGFANWDQDETAVASRYDLADPVEVARELAANAEAVAATYDAVTADQLDRPGRRSNGSRFTVESIARYHLHDVVHHLWDVRGALTVAAYDGQAAAYRDASLEFGTAATRAALADFAAAAGPGASILEIGSGSGRDALALEALGAGVRRTDVTPGFVELLRADGHDADVLDPLTDDLGGPYDAVWANASLLHVARADLPTVLARLAAATRVGGLLRASFKEGDGDGWSTHGSIEAPRRFTYWHRPDLEAVVVGAGWQVHDVVHSDGHRGETWLAVTATRR